MAKDKDDVLEEDGEGTVVSEAEAPDLQEEQNEEPGPEPYAPLAEKLGWVPKDKFKGNPDDWKPAEDFILAGKEIQSKTSHELRELRSTIDRMGQTNAAILQERILEEREKAAQFYQRAVDEGDPDGAWRASQAINALDHRMATATQPQVPSVDPSVVEWASKRPWFHNDPLAQQLAVNTAQVYANAGKGTAEQLAAAEREVKRYYPQHFSDRGSPSVNSPGGRSAGVSTRGKGFNDMPREAQKVAKDMADRGVIPDVNIYARNYWATEGKNQ